MIANGGREEGNLRTSARTLPLRKELNMSERKQRKQVKWFEVTSSLKVDVRIPEWEREIIAAAFEKLEAGAESLNPKAVPDDLAW